MPVYPLGYTLPTFAADSHLPSTSMLVTLSLVLNSRPYTYQSDDQHIVFGPPSSGFFEGTPINLVEGDTDQRADEQDPPLELSSVPQNGKQPK